MRAGRLRDRVAIQSPPTGVDGFGQPTGEWVDVKERRCSIEPMSNDEYFAAQGENSLQKTKIRFHFEKNLLKPTYRLVDKRVSPNVIYDIQGEPTNPGNENKELIVIGVRRSA